MRFAKVAAVLSTLFICSIAQAEKIKHGNWQITSVIAIKGLPMDVPAQTHTSEQCITKENEIPKMEGNEDCQFKILERSEHKYSWEMNCENPKVTGRGEMSYKGETLQGYFNTQSSREGMKMEMNSTITGKYMGECP